MKFGLKIDKLIGNVQQMGHYKLQMGKIKVSDCWGEKNKYKETYIFKPGTCDHPKLLEYVNPTQYFSSKKLAMGLFSVIIVN